MSEITRTIAADPATVFAACQLAMQGEKGRIIANHNGLRRLVYRMKPGLTNWGNRVWFEARPAAVPGQCELRVLVTASPTAPRDSDGTFADDWYRRWARQHADKVQACVGGRPEPMGDFVYNRYDDRYHPWDGAAVP